MSEYLCDHCGGTFEAARQRRFCGSDCRSRAFASFYAVYQGRLIVVPAPRRGWVRHTTHEVKVGDRTIRVEVDGHGKVQLPAPKVRRLR